MKETINNEVVDNYKEHSQHRNYDENCSECFKNVKEFDGEEYDIISEIPDELRPPLTREDEEQLTYDKRMEEAESRERDSYNPHIDDINFNEDDE